MPSRFRTLFLALMLLVLPLVSAAPGRTADVEPVTVLAAASLTDALQQLAERFRREGGGEVRFSFAASSTLARQVEAGAPADVFVSANEEWMDWLAQRGLIVASTRTSPLGNTLVVIAPIASPVAWVKLERGFDFASVLAKGDRIATGDPASVPVGQYARKALETLGLWVQVEPLLARTDSVRSALALVERGEAGLGIVYGTDAQATAKVKVVGTFPADSHPPISYPFAIIAGRDTPAVRKFFNFITTAPAEKIYREQGFLWRGAAG